MKKETDQFIIVPDHIEAEPSFGEYLIWLGIAAFILGLVVIGVFYAILSQTGGTGWN